MIGQRNVAEIVAAKYVAIGGCTDFVGAVIGAGHGDFVEQGRVFFVGVYVISQVEGLIKVGGLWVVIDKG